MNTLAKLDPDSKNAQGSKMSLKSSYIKNALYSMQEQDFYKPPGGFPEPLLPITIEPSFYDW